MRKANQQNGTGVVEMQEKAAANTLKYLDKEAKDRAAKQHDLDYYKSAVRADKSSITRLSKKIKGDQETIKGLSEQLEKMPLPTMTENDITTQLEQIAKLPWVAKVLLKENSGLFINTRPGVLQTIFHNRVVYKNTSRVDELLERPLTLPMPTYQIFIDLKHMDRGNWNRTNNLQIRLMDVDTLKFHPNPQELGWNQAAYPHWAVSAPPWQTGMGESQFGNFCLQHYEGIITASKKIIDLLNEVAIFLQDSGWARAYRKKMEWACQLGFHPYYDQLMRPLLDGESFEKIQGENRRRLPEYLKANGLTQHMYDYGSPAEGEQMPDMPEEMAPAVADAWRILQRELQAQPLRGLTNDSFIIDEMIGSDDDDEDDEDPENIPF